MRSSNGLIYWGLGLVLATLAFPLPVTADPVSRAGAEAMTRGWLAEGHTRLAARLSERVKSTQTFGDFHVVQLEPEGYIVTAADDDLEPVIAFAAKGQFETDPENPLWILLNRDVPERTAHIRSLKGRQKLQAAPGNSPARSAPDDQALREAGRSKAKWDRLRNHASLASASATSTGSGVSSLLPPPLGSDTNAVPQHAPVRINEFRLVGGQVQITHDSLSSVSILASYDAGNSWQALDSGVFQSTWISSRATRESACWFRVEEDGVLDEMTVGFMRNPPPVLEAATDMVGGADTNVLGNEPLSSAYLSGVSDVRIAPLIQSKWSQSSAQGYNCYNYYTPNNYVCGCVATAVAQVLRYWQYPVAGVGQISRTVYVNGASRTATTRGGNGTGGPYNWSAMPLAPGSTAYNAAQWQMIGALCYDAGVSVNMQYAPGGSGAYMSACANAFTGVFGYANARYNYPPNLLNPINSSLAAGCPVLLGIDNSGASGHAIVCDGFGYSSGTMYHHLNLGWGGSWDLWYTLPNIGGAYPWNSVHCIVFNVFPTGAGELIAGRVTTTAGVPVQGATLTASASGQNYTATSDAKGYYGVKLPAARSYSVTASKAGMSSVTRSGVSVGTSSYSVCGNAADVDFALNPFSFSAVAVTNSVWLRWTAPTNCGMPNNTVYIRWRTDRYPTNASDGTEVYSGAAQLCEHTGCDNSGTVPNFYAIWGSSGSSYANLGGSTTAQTGPGGNSITAWTVSTRGDFNGDGKSDLIWRNSANGRVITWHLNGDARIGSSVLWPVTNPGDSVWIPMASGDFNADGKPDVIWRNSSTGRVVVWYMNGVTRTGTDVLWPVTNPGDSVWMPMASGDFNADGKPDVIWRNSSTGRVVVWYMNGVTRTGTAVLWPVTNPGDSAWVPVAAGDFNADGKPDLVWRNSSSGRVIVWYMNGVNQTGTAVLWPVSNPGDSAWVPMAVGDFNADSKPDLIWRNASTGRVIVWYMNGITSTSTAAIWGN